MAYQTSSQTSSSHRANHPGNFSDRFSPVRDEPQDPKDMDATAAGDQIPEQQQRSAGQPIVPEVTRVMNAEERVQIQYLKGDIKKAQGTITFLLQANQSAFKKAEEPPPHCNPKFVKRISNSVVSNLLIEKEFLYPTEEMQQESLLQEFGICADDTKAYNKFIHAWNDSTAQPNLKTILKDAIRRRKGSLTKNLRDELYAQLGVRRYHRGASIDERIEFNNALDKHKVDDIWRVTTSDDGRWDPWGSQAIHAAISKAIFGTHYNESEPISLNIELAAFFFYVLTLAMQDRNLQGNERLTLAGELAEMEQKIIDWEPFMKRITITFREN